MPHEITIPRLGWSMEEATFAAWHKRDGEPVTAGDALFALESDKATQDVDALDSGILRLPADAPQAGDLVRVGQRVGYILAAGEAWPLTTAMDPSALRPASPASHPESATAMPVRPVVPPANRESDEKPAATPASVVSAAPEQHISPRALRVARELGIDWTCVTGTGRTGRIREQDIRTFADGPGTARPPSTLRQKIADRMVASLREGAPVTLHTTVDATRLVEWRTQLKSTAATAGNAAPSYTELLIHLTARALQQHPGLNARWNGRAFQPVADIHIGMAVDTEAGLLVPVLRQAHQLKLPELVTRARDLIERARTRRLLPDELRDGTFTITSLGAFGIDAFTPIINPPECAILGVGRIQKKPAVIDDQIVVRDLMTLSLTFDHRALDGAPAARFLQTLAREIEAPVRP